MKHLQKKPKMEFSKKWLIGCIIISIFYTTLSYVLAFLDKSTVETLSIEILQTLWGTSALSFIFYTGQNSVRAFTSSKWGIPQEQENITTNISEEDINIKERRGG